MTEKLKFVLRRVENIVVKGENTGYQHFLLFPQCFQRASFSGSLKSGLCGKGLNVFRASELRCARANDARFQRNGAQLFKVMRPLGASFLVVNKS